MKTKRTNKGIKRSLLLIGLVSIFQPYIVLMTQYGPSSECVDCLIIEQTFLDSLIYLLLPLTAIYLVLKKIGTNPIIQGTFVFAYFAPVSFVKITVPLFDDRIAAWSTFSDQEVWDSAMLMSIPSMLILAGLIIVILGRINREYSPVKSKDLLDNEI